MSAINILALELAFRNVLVSARACGECVRMDARHRILAGRIPVVSPKWTVETTSDGTRRLVQQWFKNEPR